MNYVQTPAALERAVRSIAESDWAAVDCEADSLHHYIEKLCLVQASIPGEDFVIDPLAGLDLLPLVRVFAAKPLVLHGADFDLRILKRFYGVVPQNIFDTMIAAQLLGYEKQGLADLAFRHCGVLLPKSAQKADWSQRPLDGKLLAYAANDTHYLKVIRSVMEKELEALGRLEWLRQCCERLVKSIAQSKEKPEPDRQWQIKGSKALKGKALTILKALWDWREEEARRRDRPSFKVMNSETLVEIAQWIHDKPEADAASMPKAPRNLKGEHREAINRVVAAARHSPPVEWAAPAARARAGSEGRKNKLFLALKSDREALAKELKIQPSLLATNAVLEMIISESPRDPAALARLGCLMPWQLDLVGGRFLKAIHAPHQENMI